VAVTEDEADVTYVNLGTCYGQIGNPTKAIELLRKVSDNFGQKHTADMLLSAALVMLQRWSEAIVIIDKINLKLLPKNEAERIHMLRGMTLMLLDREKEALEECDLAGDMDEIHFWKGFCRIRMSDIPGAVKEFSHEIKRNPKHDLSYLHRATCFTLIRHYKEALLDLGREEALGGKPERSYLVLKACIYFLTGQFNDCERSLDVVENDYEKGNYPTLWPEYDEQLKTCLLKGSTMIRELLKASNVNRAHHE